MKSSRIVALGFAGMLLSSTLASRADTDTDRMKRLEEQVKMLLEQQQKMKDQQADNEKQIATLLTEIRNAKGKGIQPTAPKAAGTAPTGGLKISGDIATRFDNTSIASRQTGLIPEGDQGFLRGRFRLRLQSPITNRSEAELYLTTGQTPNPAAYFTALGDASRGKLISIARANLSYYFGNPDSPYFTDQKADGRNYLPKITLGKMDVPFWRPSVGNFTSEINWSIFLNPEGAAYHMSFTKPESKFGLSGAASFFVINTPAKQRFIGLTSDTYEVDAQVKADYGLAHAALYYRVIDNLNSGLFAPSFLPGQGIDPSLATSAFLLRGNGLQSTNAHYSHGPANGFGSNTFNILNFSGQLSPQVKPNGTQPFLVYEYLHNGSVSVLNNGWGITVGAHKGNVMKRGSYTGWFTWRDVDADATLGPTADGDFGAGTDYRGFQLGFAWRVQDNLLFRIAYHDFDAAPAKLNTTQRLFIDFTRSF